MESIFIVNSFQRRNGTDCTWSPGTADNKSVGLHQGFNHQLRVVTCLNVCHEDFIRNQRLNVFLLISKRVCLNGVIHIIIDHTPDRCFAGSGYCSNYFDGVLSIEHIVDTVTSTDLYRVHLM